jgi:hypothetical protein
METLGGILSKTYWVQEEDHSISLMVAHSRVVKEGRSACILPKGGGTNISCGCAKSGMDLPGMFTAAYPGSSRTGRVKTGS